MIFSPSSSGGLPLESLVSAIDIGDEGPLEEIELVIFDLFLMSSETEFESPQSFVVDRGPAQVQALKSIRSIALNGFPHDQVVGPEMLKFIIGSAELIEG